MIHTTRGIVLHTTKFKESSVIAEIFTEDFGVQSFIINSVRSKKAKIKSATFFPLTLVEAVVYIKESRGVQKVSELKIDPPYLSIHTDIRKSSIVLFLSEMLRKVIHKDSPNKELFSFLHHSFITLDLKNDGINLFHLFFLLRLTKYLGFYPRGAYSAHTPILNIPEGLFQQGTPVHANHFSESESEFAGLLLKSSYDMLESIHIPHETRNELLEKIIAYYRIHIPSMKEIKSYTILTEVLG